MCHKFVEKKLVTKSLQHLYIYIYTHDIHSEQLME